MTYLFQRRLPFSALCVPESVLRRVREQLFICYRENFPAPGFLGLPPHTPASYEVLTLNLTYPFSEDHFFLHFAFRSLCFAGCGNDCFSVIQRTFPHTDPGGCRPHTPASYEVLTLDLTCLFQRMAHFSALCVPESVLRRVREQLFICYQENFPAPEFRGLPPPYPRFL